MKMMKFVVYFLILVGAASFFGCEQEPKEITARHVLVMYKGSMRAPETVVRSKEEAKALAEEVLKMANAGKDFNALAKEYSDGPTKVRGGLLSPFGKGVMAPEFEAAAFALKKGALSAVVETGFGFHVIKRVK